MSDVESLDGGAVTQDLNDEQASAHSSISFSHSHLYQSIINDNNDVKENRLEP